MAFNGAEPVRHETLERFAAAFAPAGFRRRAFYPCYGLAEATLFVTGGEAAEPPRSVIAEVAELERGRFLPDPDGRALVSSGRSWGDQEVLVADPESGRPLADGRVGEVWIAGDSVAQGYWERPEATAESFKAALAAQASPPEQRRYLRTGDLGFLQDGELFVTGRFKDLIILRGRNLYPQDLELSAERSHPALRPGCGIAFSVDAEGEERLVIVQEIERRREDEAAAAAAAIRRAVAEDFEARVWDAVVVRAGTVPKTSSGKVQRRRCRASYLEGGLSSLAPSDAEPVAALQAGASREGPDGEPAAPELPPAEALRDLPRAELESLLSAFLRHHVGRLLGVGAHGVEEHQPLSALGLDSLGAIEIRNRVESGTGQSIPLAELLQGPSIRDLAGVIAAGFESGAPTPSDPGPVAAHPAVDESPLSEGQKALFFLYRLAPESSAYIIAGAARLAGDLTAQRLREAIGSLACRHPVLQSTFGEGPGGASGGPRQQVHRELVPEVLEEHWEGSEGPELRDRLQELAFRPFDLAAEAPLRLAILRHRGGRHLLLSVHHIAADFWSLETLLRELGGVLGGESLPPLPLEYPDYVRWQGSWLSSAEGRRQEGFWEEALKGRPEALELPFDRPRPAVQSFRGGTVRLRVAEPLAGPLEALGRRRGATLFMTLLAVYKTLLARHSGQLDLLVGTPTAGRPVASLAGLVGYFVNPVVLRSRTAGDPPFTEYLGQVRDSVLGAFSNQEYPFPRLVEKLEPRRELGRSPIFQTMFTLQKARGGSLGSLARLALGEDGVSLRLGELELESVALARPASQFDLSLSVAVVEGRLAGFLQYDAELFDSTSARRLAAQLETLMAAVAADPSRTLSELPVLSPAQEHQLLREWNEESLVYSAKGFVHRLIAERAARHPRATALAWEGGELSYGELSRRARGVSRALRSRGVGPESVVGLWAETSPDLIAGMLGILGSGAAYLPLDPAVPAERLRFMLEDCRAPLVLLPAEPREAPGDLGRPLLRMEGGTTRGGEPGAPESGEEEVVAAEMGGDPEDTVDLHPDHPAYVIFTSGSTGRPKGVVIPHRAFTNRVRFQVASDLRPDFRVLQRSSPGFDTSVLEIFPPLVAGATVVLPRPGGRKDPRYLLQLVAEQQVTMAVFPVAMYSMLLDEQPELVRRCRALEFSGAGGEAMPPDLPLKFYRAVESPAAEFHNRYGPTEATVAVTSWLCRRGVREREVPIGRPIAGAKIYLLDSRLRPVPPGAAGELCIAGVGLARGYRGRPSRTARSFVPDPFASLPGAGGRLYRTGDLARARPDGALVFAGRIDHQVKIRGFRVEPGEVAAALRRHSRVRDAAVIDRRDPRTRTVRLDAYVVAPTWPGTEEGLAAELLEHLRPQVPDHMLPGAFVRLEELPLTVSGKVDREALPEPPRERSGEGPAPPRTPAEELLADLFAEVLGLEAVGIRESFFELGGHSLLVTQLISRVREAFGVELPMSRVFEAGTVAELAAGIAASTAGPAPALLPLARDGELELSFAQERLWFLDALEPGQATYNIPAAVDLAGELDEGALREALGALIARHEALRTSFSAVGGRPRQVIEAPRPLHLPRIDLSDLGAGAAAESRRLASREAARPFDLSLAPLLRMTLVRLGPREHRAFLVIHHIVADGWSLGVFVRELSELYSAALEERPPRLAPLEIQYADFAHWQRRWLADEVLEGQLEYWREQLAGAPELLDLPTDRPRSVAQSYDGRFLARSLPRALLEDLKQLGRGQRATLFMVLLAAYHTFLYRLSGQRDVVVGSPIANRNRKETEGLIGFLVNTVALRGRPDRRQTFVELLEATRETVLGASAHQDLPFEKLVEELSPRRDLSHSPLFQAMLVLQNAPMEPLSLSGLTLAIERLDSGTSKFDLTLSLVEGDGGLEATWEYPRSLFDPSTVGRFADHFRRLLEAVAEQPGTALGRLPLLSAAERRQLLEQWNDLDAPGPGPATLTQLVEAAVERSGDRPAVVFAGESLSYRELDRRSNRLAHRLIRLGVPVDGRVALCLDRGLALPVALLATLKAGAAVVPLDPAYPADRLAFMAEDSRAAVLVTEERYQGLLPASGGPVLLLDGEAGEAGDGLPDTPPMRPAGAENLLYVIYTSGSTGRPKGVAMPHRVLAALIDWQHRKDTFRGPARTLQFTPLSFDVSFQEIFATWIAGGTLVLVSEDQRRDAGALLEILEEQGVERLFLPFVALRQLAEVGEERGRAPSALREVITAGEQLQITPRVAAFFELLERRTGPCSLENQYGPSETHVGTAFRLEGPPGGWPRLPAIGRPVDGSWAFVLDPEGEPVPVGVGGELFLGGACVARGYLGRPALTAERFQPDPWSPAPGSRLYRTGDRVRWTAEGQLEFLGRVDQQVKIRGFRVEPGEVEARLAALPQVQAAAVTVREKAPGDPRLVAYVVPAASGEAGEGEVTEGEALGRARVEALREALGEVLPPYMVPSSFTFLDALPLTPSGKVNRRLLPDPHWTSGGREGRAARSPEERIIAELWAEVLGLDDLSVEDDFFALGGHSLLVTRVISRLRQALGVELPVRQLFETPTVASLARVVGERLQPGERTVPSPVLRRPEGGPPPLSFAQERLWFLDRLDPGSSAYNMPAGVHLEGALSVPALAAALGGLVERHEVLRTVFALRGDQPVQVIREARPCHLPVVDLAGLPPRAREAAARELMEEELGRPFHLAAGPLMRNVLLRLGAREHVAVITLHHIVSDAWSVEVLVRELSALYEGALGGRPSPLPELPVQYADFAVWQRGWLQGEVEARSLAFWTDHLRGAPPTLELLPDRPRPVMQTYRGRDYRVALSPTLQEALGSTARRLGATRYMVWLAAFGGLLSRYTGQRDLVVGSPIAGRDRAEVEGLIGFFINVLALRLDLGGAPGLGDAVMRVREVALEAYAHQHLPFERLVEELGVERDLSHTPIVQVLLQLLADPLDELELPGLSLTRLTGEGQTAKYDLVVNGMETRGGLEVTWRYNRDLFDRSTIQRLAGHFQTFLTEAFASPERSLEEIPLLSPAERQQLSEWNDTAVELGRGCLHELVESQVRRSPDAVAVTFEGKALSYAQLDGRAEWLAAALQQLGAGPGHRVGVLAERSRSLVVALYGVLKAGAAYVPLDPDLPRARLEGMVEDAELTAVVFQRRHRDLLPAGGGLPGLCLEDLGTGAPGADSLPLRVRASAEDPAYMIFTSGSTGRPKGAVNRHRGIVNRLRWMMETFELLPGDRVLQKTPFSFDVSVWELFWPLVTGARLVIARPGGHRDSAYLAEVIEGEGVTTLHFVPSMLAVFLEEPALRRLSTPRWVFVSGEALPLELERRFFETLPGVELHNLYGPTETAVEVTWWPCKPGAGRTSVPIGRPIANTRLEVLDRRLRPVPLGVAGELHLGGVQVGNGYWGRRALTAERFVPDPGSPEPGARLYKTGDLTRWRGDGLVEFLGRTDHQVKVRGFRIELGEIEAALLDLEGVREAVVLARAGAGGDPQLVAYLVRDRGAAGSRGEAIRRVLGERLPEYMVPVAFVFLESMPLTPSGKVDRRALPDPEWSPGGEVAPRTPLERALAGLWKEVLEGVEPGVTDNFFRAGGNSIRGAILVNRLQEALGETLHVVTIFDAPTIAQLAALLLEKYPAAVARTWGPEALTRADGGGGEGASELVDSSAAEGPLEALPVSPGVPLPLSFAQERLWFIEQLEPGRSTYNIPAAFRVEGPLEVGALARAARGVVARHESLRTRFVARGGDPAQVVDEAGDFRVSRVDLEALAEGELCRRAEELVRREANRPFDLEAGPLLRLVVLRGRRDLHWVAFTMHHIVSDGWSLGVLVRELEALYRMATGAAAAGDEEVGLPELPVQYTDFARWQRRRLSGEALDRQLAYWKGALSGMATLELPLDRPPSTTSRWPAEMETVDWPAELAESLRRLARGAEASLFMVLLSGVASLLSRISGQRRFALGTPTMGRGRRELEDLIGFFVNTLALPMELTGEPSFEEVVARVREVVRAGFAHQDVPFEKVIEALPLERDLGRPPLFQAMFAMQNTRPRSLSLPGLELTPLGIEAERAKFDLTFGLREEEDSVRGWIEYRSDLFDRSTVRRLAGHLRTLLTAAAERPGWGFHRLPLLGPAEEQQLLRAWAGETVEYPRGRGVHELFEEVAAVHPDRVAVVAGEDELSYRELNRRANRLARYLRRQGVGVEVPVGLCLERSLEMVVATLAVLKTGGFYVPLDASYPAERLAYMVETVGTPVIVTSGELAARLPELPPVGGRVVRVLCLEEAGEELGRRGSRDLGIFAGPDSLAYAMFTSGSTGKPKGTAVCHMGIVRLVRESDFMELGPETAFLQLAPISFDVSTLEIWAPLLHGGRLILAPPGPTALQRLGEVLRRHRVNSLWLTAGLFHQVVEEHVEWLEPVRQLLAGGDVLSAVHVRNVLQALPGVRMINGYGPTENTTFTTCHTVPAGASLGASVPIGRPVTNTRVYVVDRGLEALPQGVAGELVTAGDGVARGYLGRPALTAESFVPNPFAGPGEEGSRLYRIGDLVRWRRDGTLDFLGRIDNQFKLRGLRIEPGEIEGALGEHRAIADCLVLGRREPSGEKRLVAYFVVDGTHAARGGARGRELEAELRGFLGDRLPAYLVPGSFVELPEFPLNANGKVNRKALPAPQEAAAAEGQDAAPRTPVEEILCGLFEGLLAKARVGVEESFFQLGGHSLLATRLVSRIEAAFGVRLPLARLFETPTVRALARAVEELAGATALPPIEAADGGGEIPLSYAQRRLWFLLQLDPEGPRYNVPAALRMKGDLDGEALERALAEIWRRHDVLRTTFRLAGESPVQAVSREPFPGLPRVDLATLGEGLEGALRQLAGEEVLHRFDLERGPLFRVFLLRLGEGEHLLLLNFHHLVSDGWSLGVFQEELGRLYEAFVRGEESPLEELPVQYADFARWQNRWLAGEELAAGVAEAHRRLAGVPSLELPADRPRPAVRDFEGGVSVCFLERHHLEGLAELGRRRGATLFMTLLAGLEVLLARLTEQTEFAVGSPVAGRDRREVEDLLGVFVNTLVIRADTGGDPTFGELLERVRGASLEAYAHREVPFERVVEALGVRRDLGRSPLFQVMFALQSGLAAELAIEGLEVTPHPVPTTEAQFDYGLAMVERGGGLQITTSYSKALFDPSRIRRMEGYLLRILERAAEDPETELSRIPLLSPPERQQLLWEWRDAGTATAGLESLHQLFEEQARLRPEAPALAFAPPGDPVEHLTYGELDRRAGALCEELRRRGIGPESLVGMLVEPSVERIVGLLAVLKAGGAFVPLDPAFPDERLALIIGDAHLSLVLTQADLAQRLAGLTEGTVTLVLDSPPAAGPAGSGALPSDPTAGHPGGARGLAYVIYTSGSTGRPNGVLVEHGGAVNLLAEARRSLGIGPRSRISHFASFNFDAAVLEIFLALGSGGLLWIFGAEERLPGPELADLLEQRRITSMAITPSALALLPPERLTSLTSIAVGGEACSAALARRWQEKVTLVNCYGPTETTIYATRQRCAAGGSRDPDIGRPVEGNQAFVLDRSGRPAPVGVPGELTLGGAGLARGYLARPALTARRFVPHPFGGPGERLYRTGDRVRWRRDGRLEFLGRIDTQVKLRGLRLELGEVEAALEEQPGVKDAAAAVLSDAAGGHLAAFVVMAPEALEGIGREGAEAGLLAALEDRLPAFMVPAAVRVLDALPQTPTGKLDRRALAELPLELGRRAARVLPRTPLEERLARIWEELLECGPVGVTESFFDLGGHSLLAVRLMGRIRKETGSELSLSSLFTAPTVEQQAALLAGEGESRDQGAPSLLVPLAAGGQGLPFFWVHPVGGSVFCYRELAAALGPGSPVVGIQAPLLAPGAANGASDRPLATIEEMALLYLDQVRRRQPEGPYFLGGWSFGGYVAFEMARRLRGAGEEVALLALLDTAGLDSPPLAEVPGPVSSLLFLARDLGALAGRPLELGREELEGLSDSRRLDLVLERARRAGALPSDADPRQSRRLLDLYRTNFAAAGRYRPDPADLVLHHFAARAGEARRTAAAWEGLASGGLHRHCLEGDHYSILRPPLVSALAEELRELLDGSPGPSPRRGPP